MQHACNASPFGCSGQPDALPTMADRAARQVTTKQALHRHTNAVPGSVSGRALPRQSPAVQSPAWSPMISASRHMNAISLWQMAASPGEVWLGRVSQVHSDYQAVQLRAVHTPRQCPGGLSTWRRGPPISECSACFGCTAGDAFPEADVSPTAVAPPSAQSGKASSAAGSSISTLSSPGTPAVEDYARAAGVPEANMHLRAVLCYVRGPWTRS